MQVVQRLDHHLSSIGNTSLADEHDIAIGYHDNSDSRTVWDRWEPQAGPIDLYIDRSINGLSSRW